MTFMGRVRTEGRVSTRRGLEVGMLVMEELGTVDGNGNGNGCDSSKVS